MADGWTGGFPFLSDGDVFTTSSTTRVKYPNTTVVARIPWCVTTAQRRPRAPTQQVRPLSLAQREGGTGREKGFRARCLKFHHKRHNTLILSVDSSERLIFLDPLSPQRDGQHLSISLVGAYEGAVHLRQERQ